MNSLLNKRNIISMLFVLFLASLFFPIRHVFLTKEAYFTGDYSDFTSFSLYLSDILLFLLATMVILPRGRDFFLRIRAKSNSYKLLINCYKFPLFWLILWIILGFLVHFGLNIRFSAYFLIKWVELFVAYGTLALIFKENSPKQLFLRLFAWFCGLQSILALIQFVDQSPIGLFKLGESHIGPAILGVAKIVSGGTTFIRGYGTFPHPNPLSAFLVAGILITIYLLATSSAIRSKVSYTPLLLLNVLGLTVTFSRGAYLSLAVGLTIFFGYLFFYHLKSTMVPIVVLFVSIGISFFLFRPFLFTRATFSDQSTIDRKFYDDIGVKMAIKNPIFGVGIGESVLMMEKYSGKILQSWEKQPPHNYFIIAAAELGIPAMIFLIWFFLNHLWQLIKKIKSENNFELFTVYCLLFTILCSILLLMQFDHYFYDIEQTKLLLWTILALIASQTKNPHPPAGGRGLIT